MDTLQSHPSSINFSDSEGLHCNSKLISILLIVALALKEHSVIFAELHFVAQGEDDIEYSQAA